MAEVIPTLEKNWELSTNSRFNITTTFAETAGEQLSIIVKNVLLGQAAHGYDGTISTIVPGDTYELAATTYGGYWFAGTTNWATLSGSYIEITGATVSGGANNGVFPITSVEADGTVRYTNPAGAAESFLGDFRISSNDYWEPWLGNFTAGPGGKFPAWKCAASSAGSTGKGSGFDGRDRWFDTGDTQSSTSTGGNRSWFVFENTVTGAQLLFEHRTNSSSWEFVRSTITLAPEGGLSGGSNSSVPSAAGKTILDLDRTEWMGSTGPQSEVWWLNMWHSDDGEDTRLMGGSWDVTKFWFTCERAKGAVTDGVVPWDGYQNVMGWLKSNDTWANQITFLSDSTHLHGVIDKDSVNGGPFIANFYLTSQFVTTATNAQHNDTEPARLDGEHVFAMYPVGLAAADTSIKGRHGYISDLWFVHPHNNYGTMRSGATFPSDGSRQFIKIGEYMYPWDGVSDMRIR